MKKEKFGKMINLTNYQRKRNEHNTILFLINLFLAVLGLRFCVRAFSSCGKQGPLFIAVHGPLTVVASLVAGHRLQTRRLSSCGSRAQLLRGMWESSQTRARTCVPCIGRQILNHCTTREAPLVFFITVYILRLWVCLFSFSLFGHTSWHACEILVP